MRVTRLFLDQPISTGLTLTIGDERAHYLGRVLRAKAGQTVELFNGDGNVHLAEIEAIGRKEVTVLVQSTTQGLARSACDIRLLQAVSRNEKMDWVIQKAVELGVAAIQPVHTKRSVMQLDEKRAGKRLLHWQAIAMNAAQQCGRSELPDLHAPVSLDALATHKAADRLRLIAQPDADITLDQLDQNAVSMGQNIDLMIGPEGGFESGETALLKEAGFLAFRFGERILRTETAAISLITLLQYKFGDLG
ncbi:MAG: 16S rRNA (uracil(1498)-N(3))-methyltransferase [Woeseiaceae bacterium]